jgi:hypothetical protein
MMAGYIKGGAAALPLVGVLVAATLVARLSGRRAYVPAIVGVGVVSLFGLLFIGRYFGRLSTGGALVMLLAPLLCWVTELPWLRDRKPWVVGTVRLALVAIGLIVVLVIAWRDFDRDMRPLLGSIDATSADLVIGHSVSLVVMQEPLRYIERLGLLHRIP